MKLETHVELIQLLAHYQKVSIVLVIFVLICLNYGYFQLKIYRSYITILLSHYIVIQLLTGIISPRLKIVNVEWLLLFLARDKQTYQYVYEFEYEH